MSMTTRAVFGRFVRVVTSAPPWSERQGSMRRVKTYPFGGLTTTSSLGREAGPVIIGFADVELHLDRYEVWRAGAPVAVEPQVFDVLVYLATNSERVIPKEELLDAV